MATTRFAVPIISAASSTSSGLETAAVMMETLSAPAFSRSRMSWRDRTPPPTHSGMKTVSAVRATTSSRMIRRLLVAGGDVEEGDLVRLLLVVEAGDLHRVAGIHVVDVLNALHHAALVHVQTGDDPLQEHATISRARARSTAPV